MSTFIKITSKVENIIRAWCSKLPDKEWSGVLFYTYEGDYKHTLTVVCQDILVMDIGGSAYTEYRNSPEIVAYMVDNNLLNCQLGHIHSHNTMNSYFSGTDLATLNDEAKERNHFVSLIVNNEGTYSAMITKKYTKGKIINKLKYDSFNNTNYTDIIVEDLNSIKIKADKLEIIKEQSDAVLNIDERFDELNKLKSVESTSDELPFDEVKTIGVKSFKSSELIIKDYVFQLFTGSILAKYQLKAMASFLPIMPNVLSKRFKCLSEYENFIIGFLEGMDIDFQTIREIYNCILNYEGRNIYIDTIIKLIEESYFIYE